MDNTNKQEKQFLYYSVLLIVIGIVYYFLTKGKKNNSESNYVMPRGFFQQPVVTPAPTPTTPTTPVGREVRPPSTPVGREVAPSVPMPYPYPYPLPIYGGFQPYAVIPPLPVVASESAKEMVAEEKCYKKVKILGEEKETCFITKKDYMNFLKRSYNALVDSYNDALSTLSFGNAFKISKVMRKVKGDINSELGII